MFTVFWNNFSLCLLSKWCLRYCHHGISIANTWNTWTVHIISAHFVDQKTSPIGVQDTPPPPQERRSRESPVNRTPINLRYYNRRFRIPFSSITGRNQRPHSVALLRHARRLQRSIHPGSPQRWNNGIWIVGLYVYFLGVQIFTCFITNIYSHVLMVNNILCIFIRIYKQLKLFL